MIRFFGLIKFNVLKSIRIAITLVQHAFKNIITEYHHYFIFCLLLALLQFIAFYFTGFIHTNLTLSVLLSESLAGLNFFEILFATVKNLNLFQLSIGASLLFIQLFFIYIISSAASYYAMQESNRHERSIGKSFWVATGKTELLGIYAGIEMSIILLCSFLGPFGNLLYFMWQLVTAFTIQIITFESVTIQDVFIKSIRYFKQNIINIVSIDLGIEIFLILLAVIGFFLYQETIIRPITLLSENTFADLIILYIAANANLIETITFTLFYKKLHQKIIPN